jgi:hypothetical protein
MPVEVFDAPSFLRSPPDLQNENPPDGGRRAGSSTRRLSPEHRDPDVTTGFGGWKYGPGGPERFQLFAVERIVSVPNPARSSNFDGLSFTPRTGAVSLSPGSQQPLGRPRLIRRAQLALQPTTRMVGL